MQPLMIPVPPMLEQAVGYGGDAPRWFAVYWEPCGDEAMYDDGRLSGTGCRSGYLAWVQHPAVALELANFDLGSSDSEAEHWLVIDRQARRAYAAPVADARRVLHEKWPAVEPSVLSGEEWAALLDRVQKDFKSRPTPTNEEIVARIRVQRRVEEEMVAWLDATPQARRARETIRRLAEGGGQVGALG